MPGLIPEPVFIDTWGWVALGQRKDPRHRAVSQFYRELRARGALLYTSDYVLAEVITLLCRREVFSEACNFVERILAAADQGYLIVERVTPARFAAAWKLRLRFNDKPQLSFTDLTSMAIMRERGITQVLTEDQHFLQVGMGFRLVPAL